MTAPRELTDFPTQYDPAAIEPEIYRRWMDAHVFVADAHASARTGGTQTPFTIVMPPPNVTAILHVGHGLNNTVQDVIARWRRMAGNDTLWLPGTDHAGIATQNVVEKLLAREGTTRQDLGRAAFVRRVETFVEETGGTILEQLKAIGASCDWTRTRYTLSPELSTAVREAFVRLHEAGLIYRGHRVIHWCPRCLTSLSDEEAEHTDESGTLWFIRYPLADDPARSLTVATTRPETMLGDVAVAVHPEDARYRDLIGKELVLPINGVRIPVIADAYVDPAFGTGAVKVTPAHDPNDFEMGVRHDLPMPVILTPDARVGEVSDAAGRVPDVLQGVDRFEAREQIVQMLRDAGVLEKVETHPHAVRHCYRCDTVVEPRLSDQWFVRMQPLAAPALAAVRERRIRILPERWEAVYLNWLENIRDWNISRQLWWGHRIPVWYCERCDTAPIVSRTDPDRCPACGGPVRQDEDVLDTWFSSWLWPFSTLGWPDEDAPDLAAFYPTDDLVTAPEILFFWVARMIMAGLFFLGKEPFHTVYLHGTVRDTQHRKMSKSLGNGIDPMDVVRLYGADALRWTLVSGMGLGADVILDPRDLEKSFAPGRNFGTKLWNIGRFLITNVGTDEPVLALDTLDPLALRRADAWILDRLDRALAECNDALGPAAPVSPSSGGDGRAWEAQELHAGLRLSEYAETVRRFVWNELADWYLEAVKGRLADPAGDRETVRAVLVHVFDAALRLLHPIVPFITEELWQRLPLPGRAPGATLAGARWPERRQAPDAAREFEAVREAVTAIRQIRADYALPPGQHIEVLVVPHRAPSAGAPQTALVLEEEAPVIGRLTRSTLLTGRGAAREAAAHALLADGTELVVPLAGLIDIEKECARFRGELASLDTQLEALAQRLANERFISRAPQAVVEGERQKQREWTARREQLARKVETLCGG